MSIKKDCIGLAQSFFFNLDGGGERLFIEKPIEDIDAVFFTENNGFRRSQHGDFIGKTNEDETFSPRVGVPSKSFAFVRRHIGGD